MFNFKPLDLTCNLQEIEGLDEQIKPHQGKTIRQSHFIGQLTQFFQYAKGMNGGGVKENCSR